MKNIILGIVGALVRSVAIFAVWLLMPMPSLAFDWREVALAQAAAGDCDGQTDSLFAAVAVDVDGVEAYLDEVPLSQRCAYDGAPGAVDPADDEGRMRERIAQRRQNEQAWADGLPPHVAAYHSWNENRSARRHAGLGWIEMPELIWAYRCEPPFLYGHKDSWMWAYHQVGTTEAPTRALRQWHSRLAWCRAFGRDQIDSLRRPAVGEVPPVTRQNVMRLSLIDSYQNPMELWDIRYYDLDN